MAMTQAELARRMNVSQMTISRALRNHPHVDEALRARIMEAAQRHGYSAEANYAAEVLRRRARGEADTNHVICAMMHFVMGANDDESFQGRVLNGICQRANELAWDVVLPFTHNRRTPLVVARKQVDGVIRLLSQDTIASGKTDLPVPWVSMLFDVKGADVVTVDNTAGAEMVGRHLCGLGHRKVAYVGPKSEMSSQRLAGLQQALGTVGATVPEEWIHLEEWGAGNEAATIALVDRLLAQAGGPGRLPFTALVTYNDYMAVAALRHLHTLGIEVPRDLSIAGFDGALPRGFRGTKVTTATIPLEQLGAEAVGLLENRLSKPRLRPQRTVLDTKLVEGETTGRPVVV